MTPSEIADRLEEEAIYGEGPSRLLGRAAYTIRAQAEALKIATEALEDIGAQTMSMHVSIGDLARHGIRSAARALARIKEQS